MSILTLLAMLIANSAVVGSVAAQGEDKMRLIDRPGHYPPGMYRFHCDRFRDPPDAPIFAVGRKPKLGETGSVTNIVTSVTRIDGESERAMGSCMAVLSPGRYRVTTFSQINSWKWEVNADSSSGSVERSRPTPLPNKTQEDHYQVLISADAPEKPPCRPPCTHVQREIEGTKEIIELFKSILEDGAEGGQELNDQVREKTSGVSPMATNPETCEITVNCNRECYSNDCLPSVLFDADYLHEMLHRENCLSHANPLEYNAKMSFPEKRAQEEIQGYELKIRVLEEWVNKNCP